MDSSLPHRLTIDVNVVRDFLDPRRDGHKLATELFAQNGSDIDIAIAAQGHQLDATGLLGGELREALIKEGISETRQLAYLSEATFPSKDLFPGQYVDGFKEAWNQAIHTWKTDQGQPPAPPDDFHVEAHVLDKRDFFLTGDRALRAMCRRLHDEHQIPIVAMTVGGYFEFRAGTD